jgi:hypothetical protein
MIVKFSENKKAFDEYIVKLDSLHQRLYNPLTAIEYIKKPVELKNQDLAREVD